MRLLLQILIVLAGLGPFMPAGRQIGDGSYLSPTHIYCDKQSGRVYISLSTSSKIAVVNTANNLLEGYIALPFNPGGIALACDSKTLIVADNKPDGRVHFFSMPEGALLKSIKVGHSPDALEISPDGSQVFVANRFSNTVSVIDVAKKKVLKNITVEREPKAIAISADGKYIAVANYLPHAAATDPFISAKITLIDRQSLKVIKHLALANGSQSIEDLAFSKDGKYLYASHILSSYQLPTTQLDQGWMNANALSIIDVGAKEYHTTVLLDNFDLGAANPSGMVLSEDGKQLYITLSGVHELCMIDLLKMHHKMDAASGLKDVSYDLRFLNGMKERVPTKGKSPRHVAVYKKNVFVSSYFSSGVEVFSPRHNASGSMERPMEKSLQISLGDEPEMSSRRKGELFFCDASLCFQYWQSCTSCHPGSRADGLNWDLLNDGTGNPKNGKSMLYAHYTPPVMITGIRDSASIAVRAGIKYIQFTEWTEADALDIDTYLKSLEPVPSPYLVKGRLTKNAQKGKEIFVKAGCISCHSGLYHTDGKKYDVGTGIEMHKNDSFDTPTLSEVWRTAPYLYDGRAKTMKEVFSEFNPEDKHGLTSALSGKELDQLVEYVLSL